ncbi:MAG: EpsI family protein [Sulfuritalea sp.]|nr:EpsI family protein [Sulfuritalea sp.]
MPCSERLKSGGPLPPPRLDPQLLAIGGWQVADERSVQWKPAFNNASAELNATLADGNRRVGVYIAYYRQQNYERKLISSDNVLVRISDKDWAQVARGARTITFDAQAVTVRSGRLRANADAGSSALSYGTGTGSMAALRRTITLARPGWRSQG